MDKELEVGCLVVFKADQDIFFKVSVIEPCWWDKSVRIYGPEHISSWDAEEFEVLLTAEEAKDWEPIDGLPTSPKVDWFGNPLEFNEDTDEWVEPPSDSPESFVKHDDGKPMVSLVEPQFVLSMASVLTSGAKKYTPDNWKKCDDSQRYRDAALRHLYAYLSGEQNDPETGQNHLIHVACNLMFLEYFDRNGR